MGKLRKACANCIKYKLACETKRPCSRCVLHQCSCIDVERKPRAARRPKRPRTSIDGPEGVDNLPLSLPAISVSSSSIPSCSSSASSSAMSSPSPSKPSFIPELVLNDNEPLFASNLDPSSFMLQSTEASMLPYSSLDSAYMMPNNNNSFLSSVLMLDHDQASLGIPMLPKVEPGLGGYGADDMARKTTDYAKAQNMFGLTAPFAQPASITPSNKFVIPSPQPVMLLHKAEWAVLDCNAEFAQFLGYGTVADLNANLDTVLAHHAIAPAESIGLSKQNFEYFVSAKVSHFDRMASLKSKDGTERNVNLRVDIMDKVMMFTVKEVYEMRPMCFYTRWLKAVAPTAITPCDRVRCQCRIYDYMSSLQPQMLQQQQPATQSL